MHGNESPNSKPSETIKLIKKFKDFIASEYGIEGMHIIEENASPTRGLYRDDGGVILARPVPGRAELDQIQIENTLNKDTVIKWMLEGGFELLNITNGEGKDIYLGMTGIQTPESK
jgi:hypothetical protein